jgi:hypothetical protein
MGPNLNLKTTEEIGLIEIDVPIDTQLASVNALESQNLNTPELSSKKGKEGYK